MRARLTALAICAGLALSGCGGDEPTIPRDEGSTLIRLLRDARDQAEDLPDQCDALQRTAARVQSEVQALPRSVDNDTQRSLSDGADNLAETAQQECEGADTETTPTETTPTETTPTETEPPPTTTETEPPPPPTETEPPPEPEPEPIPPELPDEGGNGNGSGGTPPGQEKKRKKEEAK